MTRNSLFNIFILIDLHSVWLGKMKNEKESQNFEFSTLSDVNRKSTRMIVFHIRS